MHVVALATADTVHSTAHRRLPRTLAGGAAPVEVEQVRPQAARRPQRRARVHVRPLVLVVGDAGGGDEGGGGQGRAAQQQQREVGLGGAGRGQPGGAMTLKRVVFSKGLALLSGQLP